MVSRGQRSEMGFRYWDMRRKGMTQAEISRRFEISRQAVNRSISLQERDVMYRLLEVAQMSGTLVEWFSALKGILVGTTPQLESRSSIMVLDIDNNIRIYYDQTDNSDMEMARSKLNELRSTLKDTLGMEMYEKRTFRSVLNSVYSR